MVSAEELIEESEAELEYAEILKMLAKDIDNYASFYASSKAHDDVRGVMKAAWNVGIITPEHEKCLDEMEKERKQKIAEYMRREMVRQLCAFSQRLAIRKWEREREQ